MGRFVTRLLPVALKEDRDVYAVGGETNYYALNVSYCNAQRHSASSLRVSPPLSHHITPKDDQMFTSMSGALQWDTAGLQSGPFCPIFMSGCLH